MLYTILHQELRVTEPQPASETQARWCCARPETSEAGNGVLWAIGYYWLLVIPGFTISGLRNKESGLCSCVAANVSNVSMVQCGFWPKRIDIGGSKGDPKIWSGSRVQTFTKAVFRPQDTHTVTQWLLQILVGLNEAPYLFLTRASWKLVYIMNGISPSSCRGDLQLSQCPVCSKPDFWQACLSSSASCWPRSDNLKTESYGAKPARFEQRSNHRKGRRILFCWNTDSLL